MVTASSLGPLRSARRQRAASSSSAVESGPPETARTRESTRASGANNFFASAREIAEASSATDTLLFSLHSLLHAPRRARILAQRFAKRSAGSLLLSQRGERLSEPQQRIRGLGRGLEFGRDVEKGLSSITVTLPLEQSLAEPERRLGGEPIARIPGREAAKTILGKGVVLALEIAVGEIEIILRRLPERLRGRMRAGARRPRR